MNKRQKKKIDKNRFDKCPMCGSRRRSLLTDYTCVDYYVGEITFKTQYRRCRDCGCDIPFLEHYYGNLDRARRKRSEEVLFDYYPVESNEYLTREQIEELCANRMYKLDGLDYLVFNAVHNGNRLYLKKSFDKYMNSCTGYFKLVPNDLTVEDIDD